MFIKGLFTDLDGHPNMGKVQHLIWTLASVSMWVFMCIKHSTMVDIPEGLLVAQALSSVTLVLLGRTLKL